MKLSCIKQLVNPFLMTMMIHLSRLLGYSCWQSFLSRFMRVLEPFFQLLASALYWQSYIFGCIIEDAGCRTSGVCYVLFLLVFMSLGVTYVIFLHRRNSVSFKFWINSVYRPCGPVQIFCCLVCRHLFMAWEIFCVGRGFIYMNPGWQMIRRCEIFFFPPIIFTFSLNRHQWFGPIRMSSIFSVDCSHLEEWDGSEIGFLFIFLLVVKNGFH